MGPFYYVVDKIDGDYAHLIRTDIEAEDSTLVARALLPEDIDEGTNLLWENFTYTMI